MTVSVDAVWEAIDGVIDPELDRSLVELDFVRSVEVGEGDVHVALRLPTYWCSPNFAYLMVGDAQEAVARVPGAERVRIDLVDHFPASGSASRSRRASPSRRPSRIRRRGSWTSFAASSA